MFIMHYTVDACVKYSVTVLFCFVFLKLNKGIIHNCHLSNEVLPCALTFGTTEVGFSNYFENWDV